MMVRQRCVQRRWTGPVVPGVLMMMMAMTGCNGDDTTTTSALPDDVPAITPIPDAAGVPAAAPPSDQSSDPPPATQPAEPHHAMPAKIMEFVSDARQRPVTAGINNDIHRQLFEFKNHTLVPAVTLAWATEDHTKASVSVGFVDARGAQPLGPRDKMPIGQVSRTYLAAMCMLFADEGLIDLDAPATRYLGTDPRLTDVPNVTEATVRMLLGHTSGIPEYRDHVVFRQTVQSQPDHVWRSAELLEYAAEGPAMFPPGRSFGVSHTNDVLLVMLVQMVKARQYWQLVAEDLLHPLDASFTRPMWERGVDSLVPGYTDRETSLFGEVQAADEQTFLRNPEFAWLGGEMVSAPFDLVHWTRKLYMGELVPEKWVTMMMDTQPISPGSEIRYGLATMSRPASVPGHNVRRAYGHRGVFEGYMTEIAFYPELELALAVQANSTTKVTAAQLSTLLDQCAAHVAARRAELDAASGWNRSPGPTRPGE